MRLIFKLVILGLIIFGLNHFGVFKYFSSKNVDNTKQIERAENIVDLSKINDEFKINYVFKFGILERKINEFNKNTETCFIHLENFKLLQKNILSSKNFKIPYVAFQADVVNVPTYGRIRGIIGASDNLQDSNLVFVAFNDNQKYSNILTNEFFKSLGTKKSK